MGHFHNICLLEAPHIAEAPHAEGASDLIQVSYLAAAVRDSVQSVCMPVDYFSRDPFNDLDTHLKDHPTDLVGISTMTGAFSNALRLARIAHRHGSYVVMGGYHPSALPTEVLQSPHVDAVVVGEGELTLRELVSKGPGRAVKGLVFKENDRVIVNPSRPLIGNLDAMPHPLRRVRPTRFGEAGDDYSVDTVFTSRGCPWRCTFCANHSVNKSWRPRSPENVLQELATLHHPKRKKRLKLWDANLFTDIGRVEQIFGLMIDRGLTNFHIWTEARVDDIIRAESIVPKLFEGGLREVCLGIESPNSATLQSMQKGITRDMCRRAVQILQKNRLRAIGYFIIGHQSETREETRRYPEYAVSLNLNYAVFMVMTPYPGTQVFEEYHSANMIRSYNWDHYNNFTPVVETKGMDLETLKRVYAYCYGKFHYKYPPLAREGLAGMVAYLIGRLYLLYIGAGLNTASSPQEIKDFIFDATLVGAGGDLKGSVFKKAPLLAKWFGTLTLRVRHSPGRNVDFLISAHGRTRRVSICTTADSDPVKGVVLELDEIVRLGRKVSLGRMAAHIYKGGIVELAPFPSLRNLRLLTTDPILIHDFLILVGFGLRKIGAGVMAILLSGFRSH